MIIPALKKVGDLYEQRVYFLPQLIYSAEAAHAAFGYLEEKFFSEDDAAQQKSKVVIATVKGDAVPADAEGDCREAADSCPVEAIEIEE